MVRHVLRVSMNANTTAGPRATSQHGFCVAVTPTPAMKAQLPASIHMMDCATASR